MSIHDMIAVAQAAERCGVCHRAKGVPCSRRRRGAHLCRLCLAAHHLRITYRDAVSVIDGDVFAGWQFVPDTVETAA